VGETRNEHKSLVPKPNNIRNDLEEIGWEDVDCKHLAQDKY
jgi:hypothetical protein